MPYGREPAQFAELRLPAGRGPHPGLIAIHGGYWRARYDLEHLGHLCHALTAAGFATWSLEYRRVGDSGGGWPGTFRDVAAGAHRFFTIAGQHDVDRQRIAVLGHSAGGHLAFWLAGLGGVPAASPIRAEPLPVAAAVSLAGLLDLRRAWDLGLSDFAVGELLDGSPDDVPEGYAAASPIELLPLGVRQLVVHGTADTAVPYEIGEAYHAAAVAAGDDVTWLTLPRTGHFELIDPESDVWPTIASAIQAQFRG